MTAADKKKLQTIANKTVALMGRPTVTTEEYARLHSVVSALVDLGAEI